MGSFPLKWPLRLASKVHRLVLGGEFGILPHTSLLYTLRLDFLKALLPDTRNQVFVTLPRVPTPYRRPIAISVSVRHFKLSSTSNFQQYPIWTSKFQQYPIGTVIFQQYPIGTSILQQYPIWTSKSQQYPISKFTLYVSPAHTFEGQH